MKMPIINNNLSDLNFKINNILKKNDKKALIILNEGFKGEISIYKINIAYSNNENVFLV